LDYIHKSANLNEPEGLYFWGAFDFSQSTVTKITKQPFAFSRKSPHSATSNRFFRWAIAAQTVGGFKETLKAVEYCKRTANLDLGEHFLKLASFTFMAMVFHEANRRDFVIGNGAP
jgi:hypothetical protein